MPKKNKRPQAPKSRSLVTLAAIQSPARTYKAGTEYKRRPKHVNRGWDY